MAARRWMVGGLVLLALGASACGVLSQATVGYVAPTGADAPTFTWPAVPGAAAYQVLVSLDRGLTAPVGTTGLIDGYRVDPSAIAWQPGHPIADRPYFWFVRAFDRNDPSGVLLSTSAPVQIYFPAAPGGAAVTFGAPAPTPPAPSVTQVPAAIGASTQPAATTAPAASTDPSPSTEATGTGTDTGTTTAGTAASAAPASGQLSP